MRILLLDDDLSYAHVVSDVLRAVGWTPIALSTASDALRTLTLGHPDLAIVSVDLGVKETKAFLKGLARERARTGVVLSSARLQEDHPDVAQLAKRFNTVGFLTRPFSLLELPDALKASMESVRARTLQVDGGDNMMLARAVEIWLQRRVGTLHLDGAPVAELVSGATVDPAELDALRDLLRRRALFGFTPGKASMERRDRGPMGAMLWELALEGASKGFATNNLERAVYVAVQARKLQELPLSRDCQRLLRSADGNLRLAKHLNALKVMPSAISEELHALHRMALIRMRDRDGVVTDQEPTVNRFARAPSGQEQDTQRRASRPATPVAGRPAPTRSADSAAQRPRRSPAEGAKRRSRETSKEPRRRRSGPSEDARRRAARELLEAASKRPAEAPSRDAERERRRAERRRRQQRQQRQEAARQANQAPIDPDKAREALMMLKRLRRELARVDKADCWTILGVPGTDDVERVEAAAERMRRRYRKIAAHEGFSDEIARMANEIIGRIDRAEKEAKLPRGPEAQGENEGRAFQAGTEAMARGDWAHAARAFRAAHLSKVDEPSYMAHLGWALYQQGLAEGGAKAQDLQKQALEMLELCDTWDASLVQGQAWLARVEVAAGELTRAEARVRRLKRQDAEVPGLAELEAALDAALFEGEEGAP